jgi:leucyl-tRNA synthetase
MEWHDSGIEGMVRFVRRLWRVGNEVAANAPDGDPGGGPLVRKTHETIRRVTDDLDRRMQFHTPISAVMELVNDLAEDTTAQGARFAAETAVSLLLEQPWPEADPAVLVHDTFELVIQVNGRVRDRMEVPAGLAEADLVERAKASAKVQAHLDGKEIRQTIVVPGKLVNLVVG